MAPAASYSLTPEKVDLKRRRRRLRVEDGHDSVPEGGTEWASSLDCDRRLYLSLLGDLNARRKNVPQQQHLFCAAT